MRQIHSTFQFGNLKTRFYDGSSKWKFGSITEKPGLLSYEVLVDDKKVIEHLD